MKLARHEHDTVHKLCEVLHRDLRRFQLLPHQMTSLQEMRTLNSSQEWPPGWTTTINDVRRTLRKPLRWSHLVTTLRNCLEIERSWGQSRRKASMRLHKGGCSCPWHTCLLCSASDSTNTSGRECGVCAKFLLNRFRSQGQREATNWTPTVRTYGRVK